MSSDKIKQTYVVDFDDLAATTPGLDYLLRIKEHQPDFKCTCFTPAFNTALLTKRMTVEKFKEWGKLIKKYDWIEIAPHGFAHIKGECLINKSDFEVMLKAIENTFEKILELPYAKIFKFPHWLGSKDAQQVLSDNGYVLAVDRNNPDVQVDIKTYTWNWSIHEPFSDYHTIKAHGHMYLTNNGLEKYYPKFLKLKDVEFKKVSEYLNEERQ